MPVDKKRRSFRMLAVLAAMFATLVLAACNDSEGDDDGDDDEDDEGMRARPAVVLTVAG
ncbi:hypothetical protein [Actinophytocola sp.]|uniref:hypothetical protein n=1 Tax=Actinophytocola sp. TaxID=1872138 RepID=UPI003D6B07B7